MRPVTKAVFYQDPLITRGIRGLVYSPTGPPPFIDCFSLSLEAADSDKSERSILLEHILLSVIKEIWESERTKLQFDLDRG